MSCPGGENGGPSVGAGGPGAGVVCVVVVGFLDGAFFLGLRTHLLPLRTLPFGHTQWPCERTKPVLQCFGLAFVFAATALGAGSWPPTTEGARTASARINDTAT